MQEPDGSSQTGFEEGYAEVAQLPWAIGRPQPAFVRLEERGVIGSRVLDAGCGTGELALFLAERGHEVVGVDFSTRAIASATRKAATRKVGSRPLFARGDLLRLQEVESLGGKFDTVVDSGTFHVFLDDQREVYISQLADVLRQGGMYFMLVFSDLEPLDWGGPRRTSKAEIRELFQSSNGWTVEAIEAARFELNMPNVEGQAWLSHIRRKA